jgi:lipid-binding SYLF domain-containing protein
MRPTLRSLFAALLLVSTASIAASEAEDKLPDLDEVQAVIELFLENDPTMEDFFDDAYGYAVFPRVGKGGFIIGGAYGRGAVYDDGVLVGSATLKQGTVGFQLGGQKYAQVIFFRSEASFNDFTSGNYELSAQASAIAASAGAAATAAYDHGVTVFTIGLSGLMYEATVGGQKFRYWSLSED